MDVFFKVKNINVEYFKTNIGYQWIELKETRAWDVVEIEEI